MRERDVVARLETRRAMYTLDEKHLPFRDRGPVKKFVREWVDSRVTVGELFVPLAFFILIMLFIPNQTMQLIASATWTVMFVVLVLDSVIFALRVRRAVRKTFGDEETKGAAFYAITRAITFRPMRLPKPVVKIGGAPKDVKLPKSLQ